MSFMWGANVLIYNKKNFPTPPDSWSVIYDPKYKGKITVPDNPIQIADPALHFFGQQNPYAISEDTLTQVKDKLKQQRPLVRKYWVLATDFQQLVQLRRARVGRGGPLQTKDLRKAGLPVA